MAAEDAYQPERDAVVLAREVAALHSDPDRRGLCVCCGDPWPCGVREAADRVFAAHVSGRADTIDDAHGNTWEQCGADCSQHVVRPGKVQCDGDGAAGSNPALTAPYPGEADRG